MRRCRGGACLGSQKNFVGFVFKSDVSLARVPKERALNGRSSTEQGPKIERTTNMLVVALVVAWLAVVGLVLIARDDYRVRQLTR